MCFFAGEWGVLLFLSILFFIFSLFWLLFWLGTDFLTGGLRFHEQSYGTRIAQQQSTSRPIAANRVY
jgi:hypothetical protein